MHAPLSPALRVEWRGLGALEAVAEEWRALAERALEPNVFYTPAFALAAAPVFGGGAGATLVWSAAGRLAGVFPARIERGPLARIVGWTHPYAPLGTPLVDRGEPEAVIAAWLDHLASDPALPAHLLLPLVPAEGPFAKALDAVLARSERRHAAFDQHQRALLAPGGAREGYVDRAIPVVRRKKLRRQRKRLEEIAPVTFTHAITPSDVAAALQDFLVIEASGWKGLAGTAASSELPLRRFVETAVGALAADGGARVDRLMLNGNAIAAAVTLRSGDTAWCWKIAYSEGVARFSPGVQVMLELTERLLAEPAIARVDSCATANHPMIDHIWRERLALADRLIALKPSVVSFGLVCAAETLRRGAIAAAKSMRNRLRGR
jgi:CelD/BcsL family acetyltransferase involved in cellulose biosynthesis